ncbi:hypothetical protein Ddye_019627 [Dipteronia dyeriana]|uniref:DDE Tnp4 domain-containing protein n=1 Tax=Dipteronia dyeriana TaxID=168575 RepID=A0AAD9WVX2_9ROSI|nr:hypothetical protein Ddye_019627 [Dipteronia dyeriana]
MHEDDVEEEEEELEELLFETINCSLKTIQAILYVLNELIVIMCHERVQHFGGQGRDPENANELFNLRRVSLRNVVKRIFGIFKSRFIIFKITPPFPYSTQAELVLACVGLHNFLRKKCRSEEFPVEPDDEASSLLVNEDDDFEPFFEIQERQRENINGWMDSIAADMWRDVGHLVN